MEEVNKVNPVKEEAATTTRVKNEEVNSKQLEEVADSYRCFTSLNYTVDIGRQSKVACKHPGSAASTTRLL